MMSALLIMGKVGRGKKYLVIKVVRLVTCYWDVTCTMDISVMLSYCEQYI